jgi:hypothetical protein
MAILNATGLGFYCIFRELACRRSRAGAGRYVWAIDARKFLLILPVALAVTACVQALVFARYGGILGYMQAFSAKERAITGMGWIFTISESFPILALIGYAVYARRSGRKPTLTKTCLVLLAFLALQLLFAGLRGSRSNTIWALFWATGILHLTVRPIPRRLVAVGALLLLIFMYLYGFYKSYGLDAVDAFRKSQAGDVTATPQHRKLRSVVVGDLGRAEVQAFLLYRLLSPYQATDYELGHGRTYMGAALLVIPKSLWPNRPVGKRKEGTELEYGAGSYKGERFKSTRVYGIAGEAMLNFGPLGVPVAFAAFGLVVGWVRRYLLTWHTADCRLLLAPYLVNMCFVVLVGDSDNLVFFIISNGAIPILVVALSSTRQFIGKH